MKRSSASKYIHRKAMLLQMRRYGSLPGSASLDTCFLDGSLINLPGPYMTFERISQGKITIWNFFKKYTLSRNTKTYKPVRLLVRRPDSSWRILLPNFSWLQEAFWALSVHIPVNGAPTTDSKSSSRLATSYGT